MVIQPLFVAGEEYIDDELWDSMDETEREAMLDEIAEDWSISFIDVSAKVTES